MERKRSSKRGYARPVERTFGSKCKDFLRQFVAFMFSNVGIIGLVVGYTIAGAFIFQAIEGTQPKAVNRAVTQLRNDTADVLWNITCTLNAVLDYEDLEEVFMIEVAMVMADFQRDVVEAINDGWDGSETGSLQWSFPSAFLYSLTVITTIGYGNITPQTEWGKVATIFYAIAGMPLFLLYLSNIGDILARCFKWLYARCCLCKCCPKKRKAQQSAPLPAIKSASAPVSPTSPRTKLQRGNSDRRFSPRMSVAPSRLQGSLSMEDGVNIKQGRQELDGFGRSFRRGYGQSGDVRGREDLYEDEVYSSQDVHMNRANAQLSGARLSGSFGDVVMELKRASGGLVRSGSVSAVEGEAVEMTEVPHRLERGGSERLHVGRRGLAKAELVLGMNDLGLEYLDLPKKKGPLQRVFGGKVTRPEPAFSDRSFFRQNTMRGTVQSPGVSDRSLYRQDTMRGPLQSPGVSDRSLYRQDTMRGPPQSPGVSDRSLYRQDTMRGPPQSPGVSDRSLYRQDTMRAPPQSLGVSDRSLYRQDTMRSLRPTDTLGRNSGISRVESAPIGEVVTSDEEGSEDGSHASEESEFDSQTVTVPVTLCLTIMVGYIVGGAMLFSTYEQWDMLDGSYFCFISLSTIGFGDLVPGKTIIEGTEGIELSFIICSMYLMLGMALIAMCFNLMQEEVVHKVRSLVAGLKNCLNCVKRSILPSS